MHQIGIPMNKMIQASLAAALASISFGASVVVTRYVISDIEPMLLAFLRFLIASLCLAPIFLVGAQERLRAFDLAAISALGVVFLDSFPGCSVSACSTSRRRVARYGSPRCLC